MTPMKIRITRPNPSPIFSPIRNLLASLLTVAPGPAAAGRSPASLRSHARLPQRKVHADRRRGLRARDTHTLAGAHKPLLSLRYPTEPLLTVYNRLVLTGHLEAGA
jgi:hypothetical protein